MSIHHATVKAATRDREEGNISEQAHAAVLSGEMTLAEAREAATSEPEDGPVYSEAPKPESRNSKSDTSTSKLCLCGCGETLVSGKRNFRVGHDMRMVSLGKACVRGEAEPSEEQMAYLEESGKLQRARERVLAEDHQAALREHARREKAAQKSGE